MTNEENDTIVTVSNDVTEAGNTASRDSENTETQSASAENVDETLDASDASETEEPLDKDESESKDDDESEESLDERKLGKGYKRRLRKLNERVSEAKKEADYWKRVALEKEGKTEKPESKPEANAQTSGKPQKPKQDDYTTYAEYEEAKDAYFEALADWKAEQILKASEAAKKEFEVRNAFKKRLDAHLSRVEKFKDENPDYDELVSDLIGPEDYVAPAVQEAILDSENGPALIYELAKDPREYERITRLPFAKAAMELGKIEARLSEKSKDLEKPKPKITKAPPPLKPVGASQGKVKRSLYDAAEMTQAEFERVYEETFNHTR